MKKNFKQYVIAWAILLVAFNVIAIVAPAWPTLEKHTASFWIGYAFINAAMIGQLACAWLAFKEDNAQKTFYNLSLFTVSYSGLVATLVVGLFCMVFTPLPYWVGAVACPTVTLVSAVAVIKAKVAVNLVTEMDSEIAVSTSVILGLREESAVLVSLAKGEDDKAVCKKVADALRFSDPVSHEATASIEAELSACFEAFKAAVSEESNVASAAEALLALLAERNVRCKSSK